jgi:hypothetical protein
LLPVKANGEVRAGGRCCRAGWLGTFVDAELEVQRFFPFVDVGSLACGSSSFRTASSDEEPTKTDYNGWRGFVGTQPVIVRRTRDGRLQQVFFHVLMRYL